MPRKTTPCKTAVLREALRCQVLLLRHMAHECGLVKFKDFSGLEMPHCFPSLLLLSRYSVHKCLEQILEPLVRKQYRDARSCGLSNDEIWKYYHDLYLLTTKEHGDTLRRTSNTRSHPCIAAVMAYIPALQNSRTALWDDYTHLNFTKAVLIALKEHLEGKSLNMIEMEYGLFHERFQEQYNATTTVEQRSAGRHVNSGESALQRDGRVDFILNKIGSRSSSSSEGSDSTIRAKDPYWEDDHDAEAREGVKKLNRAVLRAAKRLDPKCVNPLKKAFWPRAWEIRRRRALKLGIVPDSSPSPPNSIPDLVAGMNGLETKLHDDAQGDSDGTPRSSPTLRPESPPVEHIENVDFEVPETLSASTVEPQEEQTAQSEAMPASCALGDSTAEHQEEQMLPIEGEPASCLHDCILMVNRIVYDNPELTDGPPPANYLQSIADRPGEDWLSGFLNNLGNRGWVVQPVTDSETGPHLTFVREGGPGELPREPITTPRNDQGETLPTFSPSTSSDEQQHQQKHVHERFERFPLDDEGIDALLDEEIDHDGEYQIVELWTSSFSHPSLPPSAYAPSPAPPHNTAAGASKSSNKNTNRNKRKKANKIRNKMRKKDKNEEAATAKTPSLHRPYELSNLLFFFGALNIRTVKRFFRLPPMEERRRLLRRFQFYQARILPRLARLGVPVGDFYDDNGVFSALEMLEWHRDSGVELDCVECMKGGGGGEYGITQGNRYEGENGKGKGVSRRRDSMGLS